MPLRERTAQHTATVKFHPNEGTRQRRGIGERKSAQSAATGRLTSKWDTYDHGGDNGGTQNGDPEMEKKMAKEVESGGVEQKKTIRSTKTRRHGSHLRASLIYRISSSRHAAGERPRDE